MEFTWIGTVAGMQGPVIHCILTQCPEVLRGHKQQTPREKLQSWAMELMSYVIREALATSLE